MLLLTLISLQAVSIKVLPEIKPSTAIEVTINNSYGDKKDWIGIYHKGASNAWKNVLSWKYTNGIKESGKISLTGLPNAGAYEARLFYKDSYNLEAVASFNVTELSSIVINHNRTSYRCEEPVSFELKNMPGNPKDWIGIYPVGSDNTFTNVVGWMWTKGAKTMYPSIPTHVRDTGKYEIRVFFNNTLHVEAKSSPFEIKKCGDNIPSVSFKTTYNEYYLKDKINLKFSHIPIAFDHANWVAIYPKGSSTDFANVIQWKWIAHKRQGYLTFNALPKGNYEARLFYNNSFKIAKVAPFSVVDINNLPAFPKSLLGKERNPAKGVEVLYNKSKKEVYLFVNEQSPYGVKHNGISRINISDGNHPKITAYLPNEKWRLRTTHVSEKNLLVYLNRDIFSKLVTLDIERFKILHRNDIVSRSANLSSLYKANKLDLYFTIEDWAEQPIYKYYYINSKGISQAIAGINSGASDYFYIIDQNSINQKRYYITYNVRNWNRNGKWEKHKMIYDVSNLPTMTLIDTIIFDQQP